MAANVRNHGIMFFLLVGPTVAVTESTPLPSFRDHAATGPGAFIRCPRLPSELFSGEVTPRERATRAVPPAATCALPGRGHAMSDRYGDRWRDPSEPSWVAETTAEWQAQFP